MRYEIYTALLAALITTTPAGAVDGVIEINQACADQTGCFAGDAAGYPVTIEQSGSYVLTGDLTPTPDVFGIQVDADDVAIDLNGFAIRGNLTCVPGACTGSGPSSGISVPASPLTNGRRCTVRNGAIIGINGSAIRLRDGAFVDAVVVSDTFLYGMELGPNSLATRNRITAVGRSGLLLGSGSGYRDNIIARTGQFFTVGSVSGGKPTGGNVCDDGRCPLGRRFYLTQNPFFGDQPLTACDSGFHMASRWELQQVSSLTYDSTRGFVFSGNNDQLPGPPYDATAGWARTGSRSNPDFIPGVGNCSAWTSQNQSDFGNVLVLSRYDSSPPGLFKIDTASCSSKLQVWCVEDD